MILTLLVHLHQRGFSQNWLPLSHGVGCDAVPYSFIEDIYADNDENKIYLSGNFFYMEDGDFESCDTLTAGAAVWDGKGFTNLRHDPWFQQGFHVTKYKGKVYATAPIFNGNNLTATFNEWNGTDWNFLPNAPWGRVLNSKVINGDLWLLGQNGKCCEEQNLQMMCRFDGENFYPITINGVNQPNIITSLDFLNDTMYVAGYYYNLDSTGYKACFGAFYNNQIHFTDPTFTPESGINYDCMLTYKNELYLGGFMKFSGEDTVRYLLKYDGKKFTQVGDALLNQQPVAMKVYNDELYILGFFDMLGDQPAEGLIKWNGEKYTILNTDTLRRIFPEQLGIPLHLTTATGMIQSFDILNDTLYIAGSFYTIGKDTMRCIAKYNHALSDPIPAPTENNLSLYPNPSSNEVTIGYSLNGLQDVSFGIYDMQGKIVREVEKPNKNAGKYILKIDISSLATGMYIVRMQTANGALYKKLLKE